MVETWIDFLRISDTMAITNIHMKKAKPDNDTTSYSIQGEVEVSQRMRDEVILHQWKLLRIDRCRSHWGMTERGGYTFPNGIFVFMHFGKRPIRIEVDTERVGEVESLIEGMEYKKKEKDGNIEFSVAFENRGRYLDLLWDLYTIGMETESLGW